MDEFAIYPSLKGKVALVTGGGSGIGAAHVKELTAQGVRVGFIDNNAEVSRALCDEIAAAGQARPAFIEVDLRDTAALKAAIDGFIAEAGAVDILFNNAAHDQRHDFEDVTSEYFDERIAVNLKHQFFAAQAVTPGMREKGGGAIVNFGSFSWRVGFGGMPVYTTAKAAIEGLTRSLARDLGPYNIRVNCVIPGWIMTERQLTLWVDEKTKEHIRAQQCLKSLIEPSDVSRMALWLSAADSRMVSSQTFVVDGGWS
jgi:NAD(P)-dependent dehydrogenase (short-subunit alcohol dehydrogenase family)